MTKSTAPSAFAMFSEGVRKEEGGTLSFIGCILTTEAIDCDPEFFLPQLRITVFLSWPHASPPKGWRVITKFPDGTLSKPFHLPPEAEASKSLEEDEDGRVSIMFQAISTPFRVKDAGQLTVVLQSDESEQDIGKLRFKKPEPKVKKHPTKNK